MKTPKLFLLAISIALLPFFPARGWTETVHDEAGLHAGHGSHGPELAGGKSCPMVGKAFANYFEIRSALANDSLENVASQANEIAKVTDCCRGQTGNMGCHHGADESALMKNIGADAGSLAAKASQNDISSVREEFGKLSEELRQYRKTASFENSGKVRVFACDMAKKVWLQNTEEPGNPYYGRSMAKCARKIE